MRARSRWARRRASSRVRRAASPPASPSRSRRSRARDRRIYRQVGSCAATVDLFQHDRLDGLHLALNPRGRHSHAGRRRPVPGGGGCSSSSSARRAAPASARGAALASPKTARITTSRLIACMRGHKANGSPNGQLLTPSRSTASIIAPRACMRSPWKDGSRRRRSLMSTRLVQKHHRSGPAAAPAAGLLRPRRHAPARGRGEHPLTSSGLVMNTQGAAAAYPQRENLAETALTGIHEGQRPQRPAGRRMGLGGGPAGQLRPPSRRRSILRSPRRSCPFDRFSPSKFLARMFFSAPAPAGRFTSASQSVRAPANCGLQRRLVRLG